MKTIKNNHSIHVACCAISLSELCRASFFISRVDLLYKLTYSIVV